MIYTHRHIDADLHLSADAVVIGTGAGGGPVADRLAKTGKRVIVLEAGEWINPADFNQREEEMLPRLFHDSAGRTTKDKAITVHQGKGVGGSTTHNQNLIKRVPDEILDHWREEWGWRDLPADRIDRLYREIEEKTNVRRMTESDLNANNAILKRGAEALGLKKSGFLQHNREGCVGSGFCELGCSYNAKMNSQRVFLPEAIRAGADLLCDCWATHFDYSGRDATRVHAWFRDPISGAKLHKVTIDARYIVLSASATGSPAILQRSSAPDPHHLIGSTFHIHPGLAVAGFFDEKVEGWDGIPQSYEVTEFLDYRPGAQQRVWIVPVMAHPIGVASFVPGFGDDHRALMRQYPNMASFLLMVHDETQGRVQPDGEFGVKMSYALEEKDRKQFNLGFREASRLMFAAGAREVMIPLERSIVLKNESDLHIADEIELTPHRGLLTAVHPMSTCPMGDDPTKSVVDSTGRFHHLNNVYIADTSLYPTSTGGPPQLTAYMLGLHVGNSIAKLI